MGIGEPGVRRSKWRSLTGVRVLATGGYVPEQVITNEQLQECTGSDPAWLIKQTGIRQRRHAAADQATSDLCIAAARRCLDSIDLNPARIDLLIVATVTADMTFPATACLVQDALKLPQIPAYDISAGCAGFVYALCQAASAIVSGAADYVLVVGGDCLSRVINPQDRKTYPLMGDGAGAVLLGRGRSDQGLLRYSLGSDGSGAGVLGRKGGGSRLPLTPDLLADGAQYLFMDGPAVFSWAIHKISESIQELLDEQQLAPTDIDLFVLHQANIRIINAALDVLGVPRSSVPINLDRYGNTSAASIPLLLDEIWRSGLLKPGKRLILSGFGAGLSWGTALWRW